MSDRPPEDVIREALVSCQGRFFGESFDPVLAALDTLTAQRDEARKRWRFWREVAGKLETERTENGTELADAEAALARAREALNAIVVHERGGDPRSVRDIARAALGASDG